jgi:hypothetical protein
MSVVHKMSVILKQVEAHGKEKYGAVDWERFRKDGRTDNLHSIVRHAFRQSRLSQTDFLKEVALALDDITTPNIPTDLTRPNDYDSESLLHHGGHGAFRLLMQVIDDESSM